MIRSFSRAAAAILCLLFAGCATTSQQPVTLTGNIMVDGPNAAQNGPPKDRALWQYRTAAAAMRQGQFAMARQNLDEALASVQGAFGADREARKSRGYFRGEARKTFLGEPYERSMAYIYRGILYWMDNQPDNARACFRSAQFEDSDTQDRQYAGDWVLAEYLDGLVTTKLGSDGCDAYKRALSLAKGISLPPYKKEANLLLFFEFGPGPIKRAAGEFGEQLNIDERSSNVRSARFKVAGLDVPVAASDDVAYQATTRGGRVMDHILGNKAVFKSTTGAVGDVALIGGLSTAALSRDSTAQQVGLGIAAAGLISKVISSATTPTADTRAWDNLPHYLSFASLNVPPGQQNLSVEFYDAAGRIIQQLTKNLIVNIQQGQDKVVFVSDTSVTPQVL